MTVDRVKYTRQRRLGIDDKDWPTFEATVIEGEDPMEAMIKLMRLVDETPYPNAAHKPLQEPTDPIMSQHKDNGPNYEEPIPKNASKEERTARLKKLIDGSPDLKALESFRLIAQQDERLVSAYNKKMEEFV